MFSDSRQRACRQYTELFPLHQPCAEPYIPGFKVRFQVVLLVASEVSHIELVLGQLEYTCQEVPGKEYGFFLCTMLDRKCMCMCMIVCVFVCVCVSVCVCTRTAHCVRCACVHCVSVYMWEGVLFSYMHENRNKTADRPPLVLISTGKHVDFQ